jgi:hypothetical protein
MTTNIIDLGRSRKHRSIEQRGRNYSTIHSQLRRELEADGWWKKLRARILAVMGW